MKNDLFDTLPLELLFAVLNYAMVGEVSIFSETSKVLHSLCKVNYMPTVTKFCLKQQDKGIKGLLYWLHTAKKLDGLYLDCRVIIEGTNKFVDGKGVVSSLSDKYFNEKHLVHFAHLSLLVLRAAGHLTSKSFQNIAKNSGCLTTLDLSSMSNMTPLDLQSIAKANKSLTYLSVERSNHAVTDSSLQVVAESCPLIKTLSLAYCPEFTGRGLDHISQSCKGLKEVSLAHCYDLPTDALCRMATHCTSISILTLEWCLNVTDEFIRVLGAHCPHLTVLGIENCEQVSDRALSDAVARFNALRFLSADSIASLGPELLASVATHQPALQDLFLNKCPRLGDTQVALLAKHCRKLSSLGIEECGVTDRGVLALASHSLLLKVVGLNGNRIGDSSVLKLVQSLPLLERLYISQTAVTNAVLVAIATHCAHMVSLSVLECPVDGAGLMALGSLASRCRLSLRDLHVSSALSLSYNFYGPTFKLSSLYKAAARPLGWEWSPTLSATTSAPKTLDRALLIPILPPEDFPMDEEDEDENEVDEVATLHDSDDEMDAMEEELGQYAWELQQQQLYCQSQSGVAVICDEDDDDYEIAGLTAVAGASQSSERGGGGGGGGGGSEGSTQSSAHVVTPVNVPAGEEEEDDVMETPPESHSSDDWAAGHVNVIQADDEPAVFFGAASYLSPQPTLTASCSPPVNAVVLNLEEVIFPHVGNCCKVYMR